MRNMFPIYIVRMPQALFLVYENYSSSIRFFKMIKIFLNFIYSHFWRMFFLGHLQQSGFNSSFLCHGRCPFWWCGWVKLDPFIRSPISLHNVLANLGSSFKLDCKLPNDKEHSILHACLTESFVDFQKCIILIRVKYIQCRHFSFIIS